MDGNVALTGDIAPPIQVGVDWLAMTFFPLKRPQDPLDQWNGGDDTPVPNPDYHARPKNEFRDKVLMAVSIMLGCDPADWVDRGVGIQGYQRALVGPGRALFLMDPLGENTGDHFHIVLTGEACGLVSEAKMRSYLRFCANHGAVATRCDVKIDDYGRTINPDQVLAELLGPDKVTHARKALVQSEYDMSDGTATGKTVYLGRPSSRQRLRVYDKGLESEGETDAVRWELETRREPARTLVQALTAGDWGQVIASRLVAFVDFRDAGSSAKVELRTRVPWYARLVANVAKAPAYLPKAPRSVLDAVGWMRQQVATSLAMAFRTVWQGDLAPLIEMVKDGERRFKPKHHAMMARAGAG